MPSLHRLLSRLADAGLGFVVVGGYAGVLHGSSLVTNDIDICAVLSVENIERLRAALRDLHPFHRVTHRHVSLLDHPGPGEKVANLYLETDDGVLDVLSTITGVGDYDRLKREAIGAQGAEKAEMLKMRRRQGAGAKEAGARSNSCAEVQWSGSVNCGECVSL